MKVYGFLALCVGIVALSTHPAYAVVSAKGNSFDWAAGYPKLKTALGVEPPEVAVKYNVIPASGWTPKKIDFIIKRYANTDGTTYNGETPHSILTNFSEERVYSLPLPVHAGKSVKVTDNKLSLDKLNGDAVIDTDEVTIADGGPVQIRN